MGFLGKPVRQGGLKKKFRSIIICIVHVHTYMYITYPPLPPTPPTYDSSSLQREYHTGEHHHVTGFINKLARSGRNFSFDFFSDDQSIGEATPKKKEAAIGKQ